MSLPDSGLGELTVVGHPFAPIGMGEHLRSTVRALRAAGVRPRLLDVYGLDRGPVSYTHLTLPTKRIV